MPWLLSEFKPLYIDDLDDYGLGVLQGLILAAVYIKYCYSRRTTARGLILRDLIPKIKPVYFYMVYYKYYQPYISEHGHQIQLI